MTAVLEAPPAFVMPAAEASDVPRKKWTRDEYRRLTEDGYLEDGKVELINGEIWQKMGQGRRHTFVVTRLFERLGLIFGFDRLQSQSSLNTGGYSTPEPDLALLAQDIGQYLEADPTPAEILLVMEASNTTLNADLGTKQQMYARSGIPEYWVVDIPNRLLHVFRAPTSDGYSEVSVLTTNGEVRPLAAPEAVIRVADLLP